MSFTTYLQSLRQFALAQVFHPAQAPAAATQMLMPWEMLHALPPGHSGGPPQQQRAPRITRSPR